MFKDLGVHLTKYVKYLYFEIFKMLVKEIKLDVCKWRDILCS